jgi:DNA-binding SARP family transcriptional activator
MFWGDNTSAQAKKNLRQTLWQLQEALAPVDHEGQQVLLVDADWIQVNPRCPMWLDVSALEYALAGVRGVSGHALNDGCAQQLQQTVQHYTGELLAGWYYDWCLFDRERLQQIYLTLLDKLMDYCEAQYRYEDGLGYGTCILSHDYARERTHRAMMRLHCLCGDRSAALRQYQRCVAALETELGVSPSDHTMSLYQEICNNTWAPPTTPPSPPSPHSAFSDLLARLSQLQANLSEIQHQIDHEIQALHLAMRERA